MPHEAWAQEKRSLGTTAGGSTYMITIPKEWVTEHKLQKGDTLTLNRVGAGVYLELATEAPEGASETRLEVPPELQGDPLARALISRYIAGFGVIQVTGELSVAQREVVRQTVQRLIGAEILQETGAFLLIHVLRDPQVLSVSQLLEYIRENVIGMLADIRDALLGSDAADAVGIIQRDERVDRFFLLMSRRLYAALRDPLAEVKQRITRMDFFNTHTVARQLERVADHAVKMAQVAETLIKDERAFPEALAPDFERANEEAQDVLQRALAAFVELDEEQAHRALERLATVSKSVRTFDRKLVDLEDPHLAYHLGIVADSIGRVKDYAANIAEIALNARALRLE